MKTKNIILSILIASAMSTFTACSDSSSSNADDKEATNTYTINAGEDRDVPMDAEVVSVSTEDAQVKLTRDVEAETTNVYVISGSVEVTEAVAEE